MSFEEFLENLNEFDRFALDSIAALSGMQFAVDVAMIWYLDSCSVNAQVLAN